MRILVGCEFSGRVRDAFIKRGHDAISCDLLDTEAPGPHLKKNIEDVDFSYFDMIIMFPPCTFLCVSGNRWYGVGKEKHYLRRQAAKWTESLWDRAVRDCERVCFENPVGVLPTLTHINKPIYIQPWMFGHPETKKTGLHLHNLPELAPTRIVKPEYITGKDGKRYSKTHYMSQWDKDRSKIRSLTYSGIADAMGDQWGGKNNMSLKQCPECGETLHKGSCLFCGYESQTQEELKEQYFMGCKVTKTMREELEAKFQRLKDAGEFETKSEFVIQALLNYEALL